MRGDLRIEMRRDESDQGREKRVGREGERRKKSSFWEISKLLQERMEAEAKNEHAVRAHKSKEVLDHFKKVFPKEESFGEHIFGVIFEDLLLMQYTSKEVFVETIDRIKQRYKKFKKGPQKRELDKLEKFKVFLNFYMEELSQLKERAHQEFHEEFLELLRKFRELLANIDRTTVELRSFRL